jgi:hypothetical protein
LTSIASNKPTYDTSKYQIEIQNSKPGLTSKTSVVSAYNNEDDLKIFANVLPKIYRHPTTIYTSLALHQINQTTLNLAKSKH